MVETHVSPPTFPEQNLHNPKYELYTPLEYKTHDGTLKTTMCIIRHRTIKEKDKYAIFAARINIILSLWSESEGGGRYFAMLLWP